MEAHSRLHSFALLKPKHTNDYAPIPELIRTVISIVASESLLLKREVAC